MAAQETRAERKAARALEIAAQQAKKTPFQIEAEKQEQRRRNRKLLGTLLAVMLAVPALAVAIMTVQDTMQERSEKLVSLIETTYQVQEAGPTKNMMFIGKDVVVKVDNETYTCRGVEIEDIIAKKPLQCDDDIIIEAVRPRPV